MIKITKTQEFEIYDKIRNGEKKSAVAKEYRTISTRIQNIAMNFGRYQAQTEAELAGYTWDNMNRDIDIWIRHMNGEDEKDIAESIGMNPKTVYSCVTGFIKKLDYARNDIRIAMSKYGTDLVIRRAIKILKINGIKTYEDYCMFAGKPIPEIEEEISKWRNVGPKIKNAIMGPIYEIRDMK